MRPKEESWWETFRKDSSPLLKGKAHILSLSLSPIFCLWMNDIWSYDNCLLAMAIIEKKANRPHLSELASHLPSKFLFWELSLLFKLYYFSHCSSAFCYFQLKSFPYKKKKCEKKRMLTTIIRTSYHALCNLPNVWAQPTPFMVLPGLLLASLWKCLHFRRQTPFNGMWTH